MVNFANVADLINGCFEALGGFAISLSCLALYRAKMVRGVSIWHMGFFLAWGLWNLYYYPSLGQWLSFAGGLGVAMANLIFVGMILYYNRREARASKVDFAFYLEPSE